MTIRHIVTWKLAAEDAETRAEQTAEIARRLEALVEVIPDIQTLQVGANVVYPETNWDVVLIADYEDAAALERYQVHPAHKEAAAYIRSVVAERSAVDFEL